MRENAIIQQHLHAFMRLTRRWLGTPHKPESLSVALKTYVNSALRKQYFFNPIQLVVYSISYLSMMATARVQPADAPFILTGKQLTVKPDAGNASRLWSFSRWQ